jgi:prepilin-type N-terminal cleavage/methylation domain-containing protein
VANHCQNDTGKYSAFTLIELLVVIAILTAMLWLSLARANGGIGTSAHPRSLRGKNNF